MTRRIDDLSAPISAHLRACTDLLLGSPERCALFLDMDGTLLELAATPESVRVPEGLIPLLERLSAHLGGAVAIISGRRIADIDALLHPLSIATSGVHGAEIRRRPEEDIERVETKLPDEILKSVRALTADMEGVLVEVKGPGLAVHYRLAPGAEALIHSTLARALERSEEAFEILPGKKLFEIVPAGLSKGTALTAFANLPAFRHRVPIMIGDDIGDEAAFAIAESLDGFALKVAGEHYGAPDADFAGPGAVLRWLDRLAPRVHLPEQAAPRA